MNQTKYQFCQEKSKRSKHKASWPLTPTVELNVLAMKRGESAVYQVTATRVQQNHTATIHYGHVMPVTQSPYDYRGMHNQRYEMMFFYYYFNNKIFDFYSDIMCLLGYTQRQ